MPPNDYIIKTDSSIGYGYSTIKMTKSRIEKGLIAIPTALAHWFPPENSSIKIYFGNSFTPINKPFSSYRSTTNENRIGGMSKWFEQNAIMPGDELVIQILDKDNFVYRIISEKEFISGAKGLQKQFDRASDEKKAEIEINHISQWTKLESNQVISHEFQRLINIIPFSQRKRIPRPSRDYRENTPPNLKLLLGKMYGGHCQICDFWFLKKDNTPYYEIHHINPLIGNNPKNLLLVCANCHRQFEYAPLSTDFNSDGWLVKVSFNKTDFSVKQAIFSIPFKKSQKILFR